MRKPRGLVKLFSGLQGHILVGSGSRWAWLLFDFDADPLLSHEIVLDSFNLRVTLVIFHMAAISKTSRALFESYVSQRYRRTPADARVVAQYRYILATGILTILLPVGFSQLTKGFASQGRSALFLAQMSISAITIGAFGIGLADQLNKLLIALTINTAGVGADLSLLAFLAVSLKPTCVVQAFALLAAAETLGYALGLHIIPDLYERGIGREGAAAGLVYYVCAAIFAVVTISYFTLSA